MVRIKMPREDSELPKISVSNLRKEYCELADTFRKIIDGELIRCVECGEWLSRSNYYVSKKYNTGFFPICKKCVLASVEQRERKTDKPNETKESVIDMMRRMDLPYVDDLYESCCKSVADDVNEKIKRSPFLQFLTAILSLPQYKNKTFDDSEMPFNDAVSTNKKIKNSTLKRFGNFGFNDNDLLFLQNEYEQWISRCECNTLAQETLFERISCKKLEIAKATRAGKDTKDLDKGLQELMNSANILPRQNSLDTLSEGQTLGQLIEKWEVERPLPEMSKELTDVDHIGQYIDVFFKGHMAKLLNLKNPLQNIYENFMKKYTVTKPEYDEDSDSEELFDRIFGKADEK